MAFLIFNWLAGAAAWFWLIRRYDRIDPEPYRAMLSVGILGGLVSGLEQLSPNAIGSCSVLVRL